MLSSGSQTKPLLGSMEASPGGALGSPGGEGRVPDPFCPSSSLVPTSDRLPFVCGEQGEVPCLTTRGEPDVVEGSSGSSRANIARFLQPPLSGDEGIREVAPRSGCLKTKPLRSQDKVLHGDHPVRSEFHSAERLDDLHGHARCLLSCSYPSQLEKIPEVRFQRTGLSVPCAVLRPDHSTSGFHQSACSSSKNCSSGGVSDPSLPGRLVSDWQVQARSTEGKRVYPEPGSRAGNTHQPRKIVFSSFTDDRLFGNVHRHRSFLGFPNKETDGFSLKNNFRISVLSRTVREILAMSPGTSLLSREVYPRVSPPYEAPSVPPEQSLEQTKPVLSNPHSSGPEGGTDLVVPTRSNNRGYVSLQEEPRPEVIFRRLSGRLGCDFGRPAHVRKVVSWGETITHQFPRIEGDLAGPSRVNLFRKGKDGGSVLRQHHGSVLHSEARRHKILGTLSASAANVHVAGEEQDHSNSKVHPGSEELGCRHPQSERPSPADRVDDSPGRLQRDMEMVGTSDGRPLCHQSHQEAASVRLSPFRSHGNSHRRHVARMVQHGPLRVSSLRDGSGSFEQVQGKPQLQDDSDCSMVAPKRVVPGSEEVSYRTTSSSSSQTGPVTPTTHKNKASKPPHASTSRLETLQRLVKHKELSKKVSQAIFNSRKPSTNELYQKRWATYVQWCRTNKVSASRPTINSICEFFIFLFEVKGLVVSTIRCYRSTLHSVLRHTGLRINRNEDITEVIRSLKLRSPASNSRLVHWNLDVLLKYLCSDKFEPLSQCSLLNLTRKTFILLALALAKRVSELQALSRNVGFCSQGAMVSLALDFRAKNDFKCQGLERHFLVKELGSLVGQEEEALLCPVRALRAYLDRTGPLVGPGVSRLFVSPRFPSNPASKNALTAMTKAVIREAHIQLCPDLLPVLKVKAHELRGVSTTLAFKRNLSLQAVMEAAQWRCQSVFASHYLKDISFDYQICRTLGPLLVAGALIT